MLIALSKCTSIMFRSSHRSGEVLVRVWWVCRHLLGLKDWRRDVIIGDQEYDQQGFCRCLGRRIYDVQVLSRIQQEDGPNVGNCGIELRNGKDGKLTLSSSSHLWIGFCMGFLKSFYNDL